jgi:hypothetical protein
LWRFYLYFHWGFVWRNLQKSWFICDTCRLKPDLKRRRNRVGLSKVRNSIVAFLWRFN